MRTIPVLLDGGSVEILLEFVFEFVFDCKVEVLVEFVPEDVLEEDVFEEVEVSDEFVLLDMLDTLDPCETEEIEFVTPDNGEVEFPESVEKAYCGKTSIAATDTKSRTLRSISLYLLNSANKELLHLVQEHCY